MPLCPDLLPERYSARFNSVWSYILKISICNNDTYQEKVYRNKTDRLYQK